MSKKHLLSQALLDARKDGYRDEEEEVDEKMAMGGRGSMKRGFDDGQRDGSSDSDEDEGVGDEPFDEQETSPKKRRQMSSVTSDLDTTLVPNEAVAKMMKMMGHKPGEGLGKAGQGRVQPVGLSNQRGTRGLGHEAAKVVGRDLTETWDFDQEHLSHEETPTWIPSSKDQPIPSVTDMSNWIFVSEKKRTIDDETEFCQATTLTQLLDAKNVFESLNDREIHEARQRANPYETIGSGIFQNRAGMKMANMDAVFDWILTDPKMPPGGGGQRWVSKESDSPEIFYFADICAGPGGFSEYVLWRRSFGAHGFGFTLKGECDFKLDKFTAGSPQFFEAYYGPSKDGDVTNPENLRHWKKLVRDNDDGLCHLVMADGGFSVAGQENIQEILSKRIYLCQFLAALLALRTGGNFVCKLFDLFTKFSVNLVYLLYRVFDRVAIHKPHTSRPANSERYIICEGLRAGSEVVAEYLTKVNDSMTVMVEEKATVEVNEIVPLQLIKNDHQFFDYILDSNERLAVRQIMYLEKYKSFAKNPNLLEPKQLDLREKCMAYWNVPLEDQKNRKQRFLPKISPSETFKEITQTQAGCPELWLRRGAKPPPLTAATEQERAPAVLGLDLTTFVSTDKLCILFGLGKSGGSSIYQWPLPSVMSTMWEPVHGHGARVELPKKTLLLAEITYRHKGEGQGYIKTPVILIHDAYSLDGEIITNLCFCSRRLAIAKFCQTTNRQHTRPEQTQLLPSTVFALKDLRKKFVEGARVRKVKGQEVLTIDATKDQGNDSADASNRTPYFICRGLHFVRTYNANWVTIWSKSQRHAYIWSRKLNETNPEDPDKSRVWVTDVGKDHTEFNASFPDTLSTLMRLDWPDRLDKHQLLLDSSDKCDMTLLQLCTIAERIENKQRH